MHGRERGMAVCMAAACQREEVYSGIVAYSTAQWYVARWESGDMGWL